MLEINATLVAIVINFIILVYILNYFLYKPVMQLLEERKLHVERTVNEAEAKMSSAQAFMQEGQDAISKANLQAKDIINEAASDAEHMKHASLERAKKEISEQRERAKQEIKQYSLEARRALMGDAAKLSVIIAEKIIMKKIDKNSQKRIVDGYIKEHK